LFYRLAIGVIKIPSLSERLEDLPLLFEHLVSSIDDELADQPDYVRKAQGTLDAKTSAGNKNYQEVIKFISERHWRGNVRELQATLQRAMIWSEETKLTVSDLEQATLDLPKRNRAGLLGNDERELLKPIDIKEKQSEVAKQFIELALKKTGGNKTKAAKLVGLNSQQTLTGWMEKLGINQQDD
jgi:DNA-binding NtrC family response regulator